MSKISAVTDAGALAGTESLPVDNGTNQALRTTIARIKTYLESFFPLKDGTVAYFTPEGGYAIKMLAGETLVQGNIVGVRQDGTGANNTVWKSGQTGTPVDMPIGVVYAGAAAGATVIVVVAGLADVLPLTTVTAARGNVIFTGSEVGRADQSATAPVNDHWKEIGHWINTGTGAGALTRAVLHFN
jgi:hypothetical protein